MPKQDPGIETLLLLDGEIYDQGKFTSADQLLGDFFNEADRVLEEARK